MSRKQTASVVDSHFDTATKGCDGVFFSRWVMFDPVEETSPVVADAPAEQRAKKENQTHFLRECSYRQVLTNLYFSKGREKAVF